MVAGQVACDGVDGSVGTHDLTGSGEEEGAADCRVLAARGGRRGLFDERRAAALRVGCGAICHLAKMSLRHEGEREKAPHNSPPEVFFLEQSVSESCQQCQQDGLFSCIWADLCLDGPIDDRKAQAPFI